MADQGLKEGFVGDPRGAEEAHHIAAALGEIEDPFDGAAAQAPPLRADHHLDVIGDLAGEAEPLLDLEERVEAALLGAFVEPVAIDQPLFLPAGLDPVALEIVETFDIIDIGAVEEFMGVFGGLDRHAIARKHVEMRGAGERLDGSFDGVERGLHKRPFAPAAFDPLFGEGHVGVGVERIADLAVEFGLGTGIEMDRHVVAHRGQALGLFDDRFRVFVTQQYEGDFCHLRNVSLRLPLIVYLDKGEKRLNKPAF